MSAELPVVDATNSPSTRATTLNIPTVLSCNVCEVTWRDMPGAPCWFCGEPGSIANPERLVLD